MILDRIFQTATVSVSDLQNPALWLLEWSAGGKATSGENVTPQSAMNLAAYFGCIQVLSSDVAKLPLKVYRQLPGGGKEVVKKHPAYRVLHLRPNKWMTSVAMREAMMAWTLGRGNSFGEILWDRAGNITEIRPIHPGRVIVEQLDSDGSLEYRIKNRQGADERVVRQENMLHVKGISEDGINGLSIATIARESIGIGLAMQKFAGAFYAKGATMSGLLSHPAVLTDEARQRLRADFEKLYAGAENAGRVAILEEGMKYEKMGIPPEDAQYVESSYLRVEDICRWFRMPPHKIQHLLRATFSNIEHQGLEYVTDTLLPWLVRWEQEIQVKVFREDEEYFAEHLVTALLRGDQSARAAFYKSMWEMAALSADEIRALENMNPLGEGGAKHWRPLNFTAIEDPVPEAAAPEPEPEPAEEPQEPPENGPGEAQDEDEEESRVDVSPFVREAAERIAAKETLAVRKALDKYRDSSSGKADLEAWARQFFGPKHVAFVQQKLLPVFLAVHGAEHGRRLAEDLAARLVLGSITEILQGEIFQAAEAFVANSKAREQDIITWIGKEIEIERSSDEL